MNRDNAQRSKPLPSPFPAPEGRRFHHAAAGVPVLLLFLVGVSSLRWFMPGDREDMVTHCQKTAVRCLALGQFDTARVAALRLSQFSNHASEGALLEAKALQGLGREKDSLAILNRLAPADQPGYAPAHVMLAVMAASMQPPDLALSLSHIDRALRADPSNADAHELCARIAGGRKDWNTVIRHVDMAKKYDRADLMLLKATALQAIGQEGGAINLAREAETRLRNIPNPGNAGLGIRYSLAISLNLQRKYPQALDLLMNACAGKPSRADRLAMADVYLAWSQHLSSQPSPDKMRAMELLEKGIEVSPESQELMMAFMTACDAALSDGEARIHHAAKVLAGNGVASSFLHYYLGLQEWRKQNRQTAREHFQFAHDLNPKFTAITNNLALTTAAVYEDSAELEQALAMMSPLLQQEPGNPYFLDTRSQILARLGRYQEAARDLEFVLPLAADKTSVHGTLAGLYQKLGMTFLAEQHGQLSRVVK